MKNIQAILLGLLFVVMTGCGDNATKEAKQINEQHEIARHSFDQAPAQLKEQFDDVTKSLQSGDLVKAKAGLDTLTTMQLSPEQQQVVAEKSGELMGKVVEAANKGDAQAIKMMEELRVQARGRR